MQDFGEIVAMAAKRRGGIGALEETLAASRPLAPDAIAATPDGRILAAMTRRIFQAGFSWKVIDAKWDGFEAAFDGFDPKSCAFMTEDRFDALLKDSSIVRNGAKIQSIAANGRFILDLAAEHGSAAPFFAHWPDADYVGLLEFLKKRGSRLGGETAMRFLRSIGKPAFIPTRDVVAALIRAEVLTKAPSGKRDFATMQAAFNHWSAQSGRDLTAISRILAFSIGEMRPEAAAAEEDAGEESE
jgi:3-methyladenine DNA glycosylase Tag